MSRSLVSVANVERLILLARGRRVMLDADLACIYGVTTARLNQQVKRNHERFPPDFMFQLTPEEWQVLMLQSATSTGAHGVRRKLPFVFTEHADRADFCVSYFNLRGWKQIDEYIERWAGIPGRCCRLLVGMQRLAQDQLRDALSLVHTGDGIDNQTAIHLKKKLAEELRLQLMVGTPTNQDEAGLRRLAAQIKAKKVVVKLYLRHPLHAKLYLLFRPDPISPTVGYLGSSNLTFAGLSQQGELNVDVVDQDACQKLARWFEDRWEDRWCVDISDELVDIIEQSWARRPDPAVPHLGHAGVRPAAGSARRAIGIPHPKPVLEEALWFQTPRSGAAAGRYRCTLLRGRVLREDGLPRATLGSRL